MRLVERVGVETMTRGDAVHTARRATTDERERVDRLLSRRRAMTRRGRANEAARADARGMRRGRNGVGSSVGIAVVAASVLRGATAAYVHKDPASDIASGFAHPGCMRTGTSSGGYDRCPGIAMRETSGYADYQKDVMNPFNLPKFVSALESYTSEHYGSKSDYQGCKILGADENAYQAYRTRTNSPYWLGPLQFTYTCGWFTGERTTYGEGWGNPADTKSFVMDLRYSAFLMINARVQRDLQSWLSTHDISDAKIADDTKDMLYEFFRLYYRAGDRGTYQTRYRTGLSTRTSRQRWKSRFKGLASAQHAALRVEEQAALTAFLASHNAESYAPSGWSIKRVISDLAGYNAALASAYKNHYWNTQRTRVAPWASKN